MELDEKKVRQIVWATAEEFPSSGGGRDSDTNPITHALKDRPLLFAAGVDIERVVRFVLSME